MRRYLSSMFCLLAAVIGLSSSALGDDRPNVVIVMTDDQGYGDLSCHGNPVLKTPNIDATRGCRKTHRLPCLPDVFTDERSVVNRTLVEPNRRLAHDHGSIDVA